MNLKRSGFSASRKEAASRKELNYSGQIDANVGNVSYLCSTTGGQTVINLTIIWELVSIKDTRVKSPGCPERIRGIFFAKKNSPYPLSLRYQGILDNLDESYRSRLDCVAGDPVFGRYLPPLGFDLPANFQGDRAAGVKVATLRWISGTRYVTR